MAETRSIKIFLAHAKDDKSTVLLLYERLKSQGYSPWLDDKDLLPGQNWRGEIAKAIRESEIFIACLSHNSISKRGFIQQELRMALMEYANRSTDSIYLISLKLEECDVPNINLSGLGISLRDLQWSNYWEADGFDKLIKAIERNLKLPSNISVDPELPNALLGKSVDISNSTKTRLENVEKINKNSKENRVLVYLQIAILIAAIFSLIIGFFSDLYPRKSNKSLMFKGEFNKIADYLIYKEWKLADQETTKLMQKLAKRTEEE